MRRKNELFTTGNLLSRHLIIFFMSLFFGGMKNYAAWLGGNQVKFDAEFWRMILYSFAYISVVWNGNMLIGNYLGRFFDRNEQIRTQLTVAAVIALVWPVINHFIFNLFVFPLIFNRPCQLNAADNYMYLVISVVVTLFINSIYIAKNFFDEWRKSLMEKEELKQEHLQTQLQTLRNQVNPHFLFNSLNTLTNLIDEDPELANRFVQNMADVYRYVLQSNRQEIVSLEQELNYTESFIFLNKARFGDNLKVELNIQAEVKRMGILTLALQMLFENAIKHNILSKSKPLTIRISSIGTNEILVSNNLQKKHVTNGSNNIGLDNIDTRYRLLCGKGILIEQTEKEFKVVLPLVDLKA